MLRTVRTCRRTKKKPRFLKAGLAHSSSKAMRFKLWETFSGMECNMVFIQATLGLSLGVFFNWVCTQLGLYQRCKDFSLHQASNNTCNLTGATTTALVPPPELVCSALYWLRSTIEYKVGKWCALMILTLLLFVILVSHVVVIDVDVEARRLILSLRSTELSVSAT